MDPVERKNFTKRRYIDSLTQAESELGSVLPYGEWADTFSMPFQAIRLNVTKHFGNQRNYLAASMDTVLPPEIADRFNETIIPLTRGDVENKDVILQWHGPVSVKSGQDTKPKPGEQGARYPGWKT